jgi:truncated hemoglobin YjbI
VIDFRHNVVMTDKHVPTLYDWAGGIDRIQELFKTFYTRVPADPLLGPVFAHMPAEHFETVAHFVSEVLGGPKLYSGDGRPWWVSISIGISRSSNADVGWRYF